MADHKPLVLGSAGRLQQLQDGDTLLGLARWVWEQHRLFESPTDKTYMICLSMFAGVVFDSVTIRTVSGTCTVQFFSGALPITDEIAVTNDKAVYVSPTDFDPYMFVPEDLELTMVVTENDSAEDLSLSLRGHFEAIPETPDDFQGYAIAVSTQGIGSWEGPTPSPTWWGQALGPPYSGNFTNPSDPEVVPGADGTDYPPTTVGGDEFFAGFFTGLAVVQGDAGEPRIPVISYYNTSFASAIAYHDGTGWQVVTYASLSGWDGAPMVHQAGGRAFVTNVGGYYVQAREVTFEGIGAVMDNGFCFNGTVFITEAADGTTPIAFETNDGLYRKFFELIGGIWTADDDSAGSYTGPNPIAGGWNAFYYVNVYITKAVWNGSSWSDVLFAESADTPSGAIGTIAVVNNASAPDPAEPTAIWVKGSKVYYEDVTGGAPEPYVAVEYSSPYRPAFISADKTSRLFAVVVNAYQSTASPKVDVYAFNGRNTAPTLIGSKSFPGHYVPAEHAIYVDAATTGNITLSGEQNIAGYDTGASRVLVKNQSTASENGVYVTDSGAWTRATDADEWSDLYRLSVLDFNTFTTYSCTVGASGTVGSTAVTFTVNSSGKPRNAETSDLGQVGIIYSEYVNKLGAFPSLTTNNIIY